MAAEQEKFREGLKYKPGSPEAKQQEAEQKMIYDWTLRKFGAVPGTGGVPLVAPAQTAPPSGAPQLQMPEFQSPFTPKAPTLLDKKLELQPMTLSSGPVLQRKCACQGSGGGECEECRKSHTLQRQAAGPAEADVAPQVVDQVLSSPGRPLDRTTRDYFEPRFGYDFSKIRIHADAQAAESARAVNALAYTVGDSIAFAQGHYSPYSVAGRRLLAHELAHSIQQGHGSPRPHGGSVRAAAGALPVISHAVGPRVARQLDPDTQAKRKDFEDSVAAWKWDHAAEILNGFDLDDIHRMLAKLSVLQIASIYQGAIQNGAVGPDSNAAKATHWAFLDMNFHENVDSGHWSEAAKYLNGFSRSDIRTRLKGLNTDQIQALHDSAVGNPDIGPDSNVALLTAQVQASQSSQASASPKPPGTTAADTGGGSDIADAGAPPQNDDLAAKAKKEAHRTEQLECVIRLSGCGGDRSGVLDQPEISQYNATCRQQTGYSGEDITPTHDECFHPPKVEPSEAEATCPSTADPEITKLSSTEKLGRAWKFAEGDMGDDAKVALAGFFSPGNIAQMVGFGIVFIAIEGTPVGWIADAISVIFVGQLLFEIVGDLLEFFAAIKASNECDLEQAGKALSQAIVAGGINAVVALLTHKAGGEGEEPYVAPASNATADAVTKDGLVVRMPKDIAEPLAEKNAAQVRGGDLREPANEAKSSEADTGTATDKTNRKPSGSEPADQGTAPGLTRDQAVAAKATIADLSAGDGTLAKIWDKVANPGEKAKLTKGNSRRLFNNQRARFWKAVFDDPKAKAMFEKMGCKFKNRGNAPVLKLPNGEELQMTIDHIVERQTDPSKALDSSNLRISPRRENTVVLRQLHDQDPFQNPAKHGWQPVPQGGPPPAQ